MFLLLLQRKTTVAKAEANSNNNSNSMGDAINFGPAWLRKVATFDSNAVSSIGGPPHSSSNNNNISSSSSSSSTNNNQTINSSNQNNNNSSSSGSAGGGTNSGSYSAALAAANAAAAATASAAAAAAAAAATTTTRYALAEFRYGREEMLALFDVKVVKTPEILVNFKNLYVDKVQCPLALTPCTDDDVVPEPDTRVSLGTYNFRGAKLIERIFPLQRIWQTRSTSLGVPGRGARGGSVDRGRGRGRGLYLGYQRSTSFYDDESRSVGRVSRVVTLQRSFEYLILLNSSRVNDHGWNATAPVVLSALEAGVPAVAVARSIGTVLRRRPGRSSAAGYGRERPTWKAGAGRPVRTTNRAQRTGAAVV